jgi:hypothetical protein
VAGVVERYIFFHYGMFLRIPKIRRSSSLFGPSDLRPRIPAIQRLGPESVYPALLMILT